MKCPICGNRLARLADPCLHCAAVLSGRASASTTPVRAAPTDLTLPAELRVPEAAARTRATAPTPVVPIQAAGSSSAPAAGLAEPGPVQAASSTASGAVPKAGATPGPPTEAAAPKRADGSSAIRAAALVGIAVMALALYVGAHRAADSRPAAPLLDAAPAVADPASGAADSLASAVPARPPTSVATLQSAPPKTRSPTAKNANVVPSTASAAEPLAVPAAPSPRPVAEMAPPPVPDALRPDPLAACGQRGFIAKALCINERCAQAALAGHAECVKLRKAAEDAELANQRGG